MVGIGSMRGLGTSIAHAKCNIRPFGSGIGSPNPFAVSSHNIIASFVFASAEARRKAAGEGNLTQRRKGAETQRREAGGGEINAEAQRRRGAEKIQRKA